MVSSFKSSVNCTFSNRFFQLVNDLGGVQVVLGVQSLERLENLLIFNLRFCL